MLRKLTSKCGRLVEAEDDEILLRFTSFEVELFAKY